MEIFLDTTDLKKISFFDQYGLLDGITTNPSLISKINGNFLDHIKEICQLMNNRPVSVEVIAKDFETMKIEAMKIADISANIVVKIPMTWPGIKLCKFLKENNIKSNMTLCFSVTQALLAAKSGATYVSPFVGRLDDISVSGIKLVEDVRKIFDNYNMETKILSASIRTVDKIKDLALIGTDVVTINPDLLEQMLNHHLTDSGLETFTQDWNKSGFIL